MSDSLGNDIVDIFKEPDDYYHSAKPPTFAQYILQSGLSIDLRLVGHNPLWGHHLWNGARTISRYIEDNEDSLNIKSKTVLELGAGTGLPSLVCAHFNAISTVITDYPDSDLIENLRYNIAHCNNLKDKSNIHAEGHLWGQPTDKLTTHLPQASKNRFDLIILADLLFNHSEHVKLIATVTGLLSRSQDALALVFFTPYRPWLLQKDLHFFTLAEEQGLKVNKVFEQVLDKVMFEQDPGDELLRKTVMGFELRWQDSDILI